MVQVEQIFRDIEDMCFLRTGEGMKSVMKTEFTVVEAIMQASGSSRMEETQQDINFVGWENEVPSCCSLVDLGAEPTNSGETSVHRSFFGYV